MTDTYSFQVNGVFGDLVLSTAVAFVFCLLIESPTIVLTKILLDNRDRKPKAYNKSDLATKEDST